MEASMLARYSVPELQWQRRIPPVAIHLDAEVAQIQTWMLKFRAAESFCWVGVSGLKRRLCFRLFRRSGLSAPTFRSEYPAALAAEASGPEGPSDAFLFVRPEGRTS